MLIVTYRYVACILNTSHAKSDIYSDDMQDPRIAHCLSELLHDTADKNIQQFGCNGTCEDDWPKVVLKCANMNYKNSHKQTFVCWPSVGPQDNTQTNEQTTNVWLRRH